MIREMHEKEEGCRMFLFMVKEENICSSFPTVKYRNIWCSRSYHEDHEVLPWMVSWSLICRSSSNYELAFPWLRFQEVIGLRPCSLFLAWWSKNILYAKVDTENKRLLYACRIFSCDHQVYTRNCPLHYAKKKTLLLGHSIWVCGRLCFLVLNLWWPCTYLSETLHSVGWSTATSCYGSPEHGGRWTRPPPPSSWRFSSSLQGHHLRPAAPHQVLRARWGFLVSISSIFFTWFRLQALTATMLELLLQATARGGEGMTLFFLCWHITEKMFICFLDAL